MGRPIKQTPHLEACPFCNGEAYLITWRDEKERRNPASVKCRSCGAHTKVFDRIKDAIAAWNRRVTNANCA